jgi:sulfur-oxidizing protein SoxA
MNKTILIAASSLLVAGLFAGAIQAGSGSVEDDIAAFQGYFKEKFPEVALSDYKDGVNALPQYAHRRANWEILMEFPPYELEMETAREEWATPFANGQTFSDCFANNPPAPQYPYYDAATDDIRTVVGDINACLEANGEAPIKNLKNGKIARLVAAFREQFNGEKMSVEVSSDGARNWYEKGKEYYWTKRGQLNFACADCHVISAGKNIRGDVLSAGLGHTTGFPVYRTKWAQSNKPWGTVHRRYAGCNKQVRAKPLKPQSNEYKALEFYEAVMNTGVPLVAPSQRQ